MPPARGKARCAHQPAAEQLAPAFVIALTRVGPVYFAIISAKTSLSLWPLATPAERRDGGALPARITAPFVQPPIIAPYHLIRQSAIG